MDTTSNIASGVVHLGSQTLTGPCELPLDVCSALQDKSSSTTDGKTTQANYFPTDCTNSNHNHEKPDISIDFIDPSTATLLSELKSHPVTSQLSCTSGVISRNILSSNVDSEQEVNSLLNTLPEEVGQASSCSTGVDGKDRYNFNSSLIDKVQPRYFPHQSRHSKLYNNHLCPKRSAPYENMEGRICDARVFHEGDIEIDPSTQHETSPDMFNIQYSDLKLGNISQLRGVSCEESDQFGISTEQCPHSEDSQLAKLYDQRWEKIITAADEVCLSLVLESKIPYLDDQPAEGPQGSNEEHTLNKLSVTQKFVDAIENLQENQLPTKRRGNLPKECIAYLKNWFDEHSDHPCALVYHFLQLKSFPTTY